MQDEHSKGALFSKSKGNSKQIVQGINSICFFQSSEILDPISNKSTIWEGFLGNLFKISSIF